MNPQVLTIEGCEVHYITEDTDVLAMLFEKISNEQKDLNITFDTETTGLSNADRVFMVQFMFHNEHMDRPTIAVYHDKNFKDADHNTKLTKVFELFFKYFGQQNVLIAHNFKFDYRMVQKYNPWPELATKYKSKLKYFCTRETEDLFNAKVEGFISSSLKETSKRYGVVEKMDEVDKYIREHKLYDKIRRTGGREHFIKPRFYECPDDLLVKYGCIDCISTYQIYTKQKERLDNERRNKSV